VPSVYSEEPSESGEPRLLKWRNRIVGHAVVPINDLLANPLNWRVHPQAQKDALRDLIQEVGLVDSVMVNVQTGNMVDGHLRTLLADEEGETHLLVDYVDLDPEEEAKVLAGFDTITVMALVDKPKLAETIGAIASAGPALSAALAEMLENGIGVGDRVQADGPSSEQDDDEEDKQKERSTGELLARLKEVTIGEPKHTVHRGEIYQLGEHVLVVAHPMRDWPSFTPYLTDANCRLLTYPGPYAPLSEMAAQARLVMVQPDVYLAGHLLDRFTDVHGAAALTKIA
jgi:hypothetical protein